MEISLFLKAAGAFAFVLSLMGLLAFALRKFAPGAASLAPARRRLKIVETLPLDHRRRLVLISRDGQEHLIILGTEETVVETGITPGQGNAA